MIRIYDKEFCTGCHACVSVCPRKCIVMGTDEEGFLYPKVDVGACIQCEACVRVCPVLHPYEQHLPMKAYASRHTDEDIRMLSSSGGIFTRLAEEVIRRDGVVFGARYDERWQVVHTWTDTLEGIACFRGAKYVQSIIGDTYRQARNFLRQGKRVLFTGTPCQIAGLKHFLKMEYDTLLTVDVVCHGVPSPRVWQAYLDAINPRHEPITALTMRDKSRGWSRYRMEICTAEHSLYSGSAARNVFSRGFLADFYLRPSCHACPAKQGKSGSDLTLGDFWDIAKISLSMDDDRGVSLVVIQSQKGMNFCRALGVCQEEVTYGQAVRSNPALERSAPLTSYRAEFWTRFPKEGMKVVRWLWWRKRVAHYFLSVILNVVKNLKSISWCKQILRDTQDDMIR